jgi:putative peptidoglycan lipid II flippase
MLCAGISMAANVVLSVMLFTIIGATGIAIATALSGWIGVGLLFTTHKQREGFTFDPIFRRRVLGIVAASGLMGVVVFALVRLLDPWFDPANGLLVQALALCALVGLGLLSYLGAAHLFGAAKFGELIKDQAT